MWHWQAEAPAPYAAPVPHPLTIRSPDRIPTAIAGRVAVPDTALPRQIAAALCGFRVASHVSPSAAGGRTFRRCAPSQRGQIQQCRMQLPRAPQTRRDAIQFSVLPGPISAAIPSNSRFNAPRASSRRARLCPTTARSCSNNALAHRRQRRASCPHPVPLALRDAVQTLSLSSLRPTEHPHKEGSPRRRYRHAFTAPPGAPRRGPPLAAQIGRPNTRASDSLPRVRNGQS
mgnify:CR=1 FL=1